MDRAPSLQMDIHEGIEDTLRIMQHKLRQGVEVIREFDRGLPQVMAQGSELNQVWTNLFDNAIGAMDGKGTITIKTYLDDNAVTVAITDDGPGIPKEIQHLQGKEILNEKLFEAVSCFQRSVWPILGYL